MNKYVKEFIHRGLIFGGFGPIILGIVNYLIDENGIDLNLKGADILLSIVTIYLTAFIHAGSSVFPQIDSWSKVKAMFFQFLSIYVAYTFTYLINGWMKFNTIVFFIYTSCFIIVFFSIWLFVFISTKKISKKLNEKLLQNNLYK